MCVQWSDINRDKVLLSKKGGSDLRRRAQRMKQSLERFGGQSNKDLVRKQEYRMTTRGGFFFFFFWWGLGNVGNHLEKEARLAVGDFLKSYIECFRVFSALMSTF